jgi:outer membrane protein OmpA-like peptidoglycan-associated protein
VRVPTARGAVLFLTTVALAGCGLPRTYAVLMPESDGSVGRVELRSQEGTRELANAGVAAGFDLDTKPKEVDASDVRRRFGKALDATPEEPARFVLLFPSDSTRLSDASRATLPQIVETAKRRVVAEVMLIGHADRSGPAKYNDRLALARARAIQQELVKHGLPKDRIEIIALGEKKPVVPTKDGIREPKNRRVDVTVR